MLSRRAFLERGSLALAALSLSPARAAEAQTGPLGRPIGLQLYTIRDAVAKDLAGTLRAISQFGYREVELAGIPAGTTASELRRILGDNGLSAPSMHASMVDLQEDLDELIDYAKGLGSEYLVCSFPWTADSRFREKPGHAVVSLASGITLDDWKWNAEQLNRIGAACQQAGLRCGYHNHNMEFRSYDGDVAYDRLLEWTDPQLVTMELDIAWVVTAGVDPVKYLKRHDDRISMLHVKDVIKDVHVTTDRLQPETTEVGSGKIDWRRVFKACNPQRLTHYFVEQENFDRPPLESVKISFDYLKGLAARD